MTPADPFHAELLAAMPALRRRCHVLTGNRHDAEDLVQTTLLSAIEARDSFTLGTSITAWLFTIARNRRFTEKRKGRNRDPHVNVEVPALEGFPRLTVAAAGDDRLLLRDCLRVLGRASPEQRDVFRQVRMEGAEHQAYAAATGINENTSKSRLHRVDAQLRKLVGP